MHMFVGAIFLMLGGACVAYLWAGGSIFEREPPLLAFGILLIVLGAGLAGRSRAAPLPVRAGPGAGLVAPGWVAPSHLGVPGARAPRHPPAPGLPPGNGPRRA